MRTTLKIDDDLYWAAKSIAETENKSVGQVISALLRKSSHFARIWRKCRRFAGILRRSPKMTHFCSSKVSHSNPAGLFSILD